jgi:nitroreductase
MPALVSAWDAGTDMICREAPHLIVAHQPAELPAGTPYAAIAMTYLELAALPLGAGTCWAGFVMVGAGASPQVHGALQLPEGRRCAGIVMAGRPAVSYLRVPQRKTPAITWQ